MKDTATQDILSPDKQTIAEQKTKIEELNTELNLVRGDLDRFVQDVAKKIGTENWGSLEKIDTSSVLSKLRTTMDYREEAQKFKDQLEREIQARKEDSLKYQEELEKLRGKLDTLSHQFSVEMQVMQEKYQERIKHLETQLTQANQQASQQHTQVSSKPIYQFLRKFGL